MKLSSRGHPSKKLDKIISKYNQEEQHTTHKIYKLKRLLFLPQKPLPRQTFKNLDLIH